MPNETKKRPDTLELEVLGASRPTVGQRGDNVDSDECSKQQKPSITVEQTKAKNVKIAEHLCSSNEETASLGAPDRTKQPEETAVPEQRTRRRWFHIRCGTRREKGSSAVAARNASATARKTAAKTATLAKPEPTTIANSTTTIVTPLPSSQTIPDVAAVLSRSSLKQRRDNKRQPESLYSIATLAQSGEIQLQPRSEPNVHHCSKHVDHAECAMGLDAAWMHASDTNLTTATASKDVTEGLAIFVDENTSREQALLTTEQAATDDENVQRPASRLRACFMSLLGKLTVWKHRNCQQQRRRRRKSWSSHTTTSGNEGSANGFGYDPTGHKGVNISGDFEQITTTPVSGGSDIFGRAKDSGIRRLSQIRRRRSSFYFSENERRIRANNREFNAQFKYTDNYIKTSKYSMLTFLPFNLLEQFQRLANFYFLCLLVLQLIPAISSLTPVTTAIPLIGVLTLTAVKDAYDDIQRHLSDSQVNNRKSKTLRNGRLVDEKWSGVQVGDVIRMENNQFVAADILLLTTSEPNGLCFIETAELDGETNLKCKQCLPETTELGQLHDLLWNFNGEIICEQPNNLLNKFEGTLMWKNQRFSLDNEKILLRGCVLRNTQWCYGVVIFAGKDTKLMQNSGKTQFKSTGVDRLLNFIIIGIVLFLLSICAFFTVACAIWEGLIGQHFQAYLPWENIVPKSVPEGATVIGLLIFFSYAIVLNTVVPISLYVSVEVIRFAQSFLINWDEKMCYERTKTHAKARTTTLNEELGQIQYIFSDKTGTLTQNIMTFNKCSINGRTYGEVIDLRTGEVIEMTDKQTSIHNYKNVNNSSNKSTPHPPPPPLPTILLHSAEVHQKSTIVVSTATPTLEYVPTAKSAVLSPSSNESSLRSTATKKITHQQAVAFANSSIGADAKPPAETTVQPSERTAADNEMQSLESFSVSPSPSPSLSPPLTPSWSSVASTKPRIRRQASSQSDPGDKALRPVDFSANPEYEPDFRWFDQTLLDAVRSDEEHAHTFFRLLSLCHTVMPEYVEGRLEYQAQSPDESALVSAARNFGFVFRSRTPSSITIEVMGNTEEYELLHILDFNNIRKRMSVILRRGNHIVLYCKGADNVIYDRLSFSQHDIKTRTQEHLNKFAGEGLRTLVLAERRLEDRYYNDWRQRQQEASVSLNRREEKLDAIYEEIESEMVLVGVTAIEDKLQDGVPETIANLQMAGIKIWVLTGDKQETAINIGYSCQLLTDELADVFIVDGASKEEVEIQLRQFRDSIHIVNRFRPTPLDPAINLNGSDRNTSSNSVFRAQVTMPPPPAISVVTFRWDNDRIKRNKGEPDSAECNELYNSLEKGGNAKDSPMHDDFVVDEGTGFAIVINGHSLVHCLSPELESRFLEIASQCKAVICCRVTPLQKALVVELIKRAKKAVTLAIGDGANDVSMIKAAHIGVGISGQEGLQAVLASDYSIAQFRYLERLLLVHGRWSYYRMCKFLRYFFYKNFAFTLCHCWYSFFCGFSAQTVFDPMFISVYNLFYTSLPVLALGVFEQDVSDKHSVEYPKLYTPGLKNQLFNTKEFVYSVLHGVFSSLILFLIPYGTYKDGISPNGLILSDHMTLGAVVATILIIDNTAQIALYTSYWTIFNHITIWGSLIWYFVLDYFYNYVIGGPYVGSLTQAMKDLTFWVTMFITVTVIMAPVLAYKFYLIDVTPSLSDKIMFKRRQADIRSRQNLSNVKRTPSARKARRSLRSGYAFAHQEGFGRLITSGKIMRKLPQEFAFPLGLGSKRVQSSPTSPTNTVVIQNNNNNLNGNLNPSDDDLKINNISASGNSRRACRDDYSEDGSSPRAPHQDLDTINL